MVMIHWRSAQQLQPTKDESVILHRTAFQTWLSTLLAGVLKMARVKRLCIKVGRGQGYGEIGTHVWGLGTWGRETRDLRTSSMGRGDVWDGHARGDVKNRDGGDAGCEWLSQKSEVIAISLSSRKWAICLSSKNTLDTFWCLHKIFLYINRSKRTDYRD